MYFDLKSINWCQINNFPNYQISQNGHIWDSSENRLINIDYTTWKPIVQLSQNNITHNVNLRKLTYFYFDQLVENFTWKPSPNYSNYLISEYGHVWSTISNKLLKIQYDKDGYPRVNLRKNYKNKTIHIHTLVLETFISKKPKNMVARHYPDFKITNNHYTNLKWGTLEENATDRVEHGHHHWNNCLTENQVFEIVNLVIDTNLTYQQIGEKFNVSQTYVSNIVNGNMWQLKCQEKLKDFTGRRTKNITLKTKSKIKTMIIHRYNRKTILHHLNISTEIYERFISSQEFKDIRCVEDLSFLKTVQSQLPGTKHPAC